MNFERLNRLFFTGKNPGNNHVRWDIGSEPTSPRYKFEDLDEKGYQRIIRAKAELDRLVHESVLEYLNDEDLCNDREEMFPKPSRMTGNYYVGEECYCRGEDGSVEGHVLTRFTELFQSGAVQAPAEQDYLGLEVGFVMNQNGEIEITSIDSSSI